jgi:hypothetical protein
MIAQAVALACVVAVSAAAPPGQQDDVKFAETFVATPVDALTPAAIGRFMRLDAKALPPKLRLKHEARRVELQALRQLSESKKKGLIRSPEKDCAIPAEAKSDEASPLTMAGFSEIQEDEEQMLLEKTQCTERDLMCESSLQIVVLRDKKTNKITGRRLFLYPSDPLMALVAAYRSSRNVGGNTNFFGRPNVLCTH